MCELVDYDKYFINTPSDIDTREEVEKNLLTSSIKETLSTLTEREAQILYLRFFEELTLRKTGEFFNLSVERIRQIEGKALRKIRHPSRALKLVEFWEADPGLYKEEHDEEKIKLKEKVCEIAKAEAEIKAFNEECKEKADNAEKRRLEYIKFQNENRDLIIESHVFWRQQHDLICRSIDSRLEWKTFRGECSCQQWERTYPVSFDKYELVCMSCFDRFIMTSN
jgi:DNA-binding CsgD family transcriptional regulator